MRQYLLRKLTTRFFRTVEDACPYNQKGNVKLPRESSKSLPLEGGGTRQCFIAKRDGRSFEYKQKENSPSRRTATAPSGEGLKETLSQAYGTPRMLYSTIKRHCQFVKRELKKASLLREAARGNVSLPSVTEGVFWCLY